MSDTSTTTMTQLQSIIYKGLLRAEDPHNLENLFEILDEVCDELSDEFFILDYENPNSPQPIIIVQEKQR